MKTLMTLLLVFVFGENLHSQVSLEKSMIFIDGHSRFIIKAEDGLGYPCADGEPSLFEVRSKQGDPVPVDIRRINYPLGYLLILLPSDISHKARMEWADAIRNFVKQLPPEVFVGLLYRDESLGILQDFSRLCIRLDESLRRYESLKTPRYAMPFSTALYRALDYLSAAGGKGAYGMKMLLVVGSRSEPASPGKTLAYPAFFVLGEQSLKKTGSAGNIFLKEGTDAGSVMNEILESINLLSRNGYYEMKLQGDTGKSKWELYYGDKPTGIKIDPPGKNTSKGLNKLAFTFTDNERKIYNNVVRRKAKDDFTCKIIFPNSGISLPGKAHLRGKGALSCDRKSYTLKIKSSSVPFFKERFMADSVNLVAMCQDDFYIRQYMSNLLLEKTGLRYLPQAYTEVVVDGKTRGVYLAMEHAETGLKNFSMGLTAILRRKFNPPKTLVEVEHSSVAKELARKNYYDVMKQIEKAGPAVLAQTLREYIDLDQYLKWIAVNTILLNGDYVDELWLYSSDTIKTGGQLLPRYSLMGWDYEDICSSCHYHGKYAFSDPNGLVYCAESELDKKIFSNADIYDMYVDVLEKLLVSEITEQSVKDAIDRTLSDLLPFFKDPSLCRAMQELLKINPKAADPSIAVQAIKDNAVQLFKRIREQRLALFARIEKYKK